VSIIIIGAGGQGKVTLDILRGQKAKIIGFVDDNQEKKVTTVNDCPVLGTTTDLFKKKLSTTVSIAIGDNKTRKKIYEQCKKEGINVITIIHPSAIISPNTKIGEGVTIMPGAIINTNANIGNNVIINTKASIDHDNILEDHCQIQPGATLTGTVTVKELATIGSGATILPGIIIGKNAFVGAGAVVTKNVMDNETVVGIPAKPVKK
jgi:UDP-perosamine 4-acetyltransferase